MINKRTEVANPMYLIIFTIFAYLLFIEFFRGLDQLISFLLGS